MATLNLNHEKKARRIATLLAGYMRDALTPAEHDELDEWVGASDKNMRLFEELTDERRVQLALELLNDNTAGLINKLQYDKEYVYSYDWCTREFMMGVMTVVAINGIIELARWVISMWIVSIM